MLDIELQGQYALMSTVFLVLAFASAFYLIDHSKSGWAAPVTLGAFLLAAASSIATLMIGAISLTRISDLESTPQPLTPELSDGLELLDNAMRAGLAVTFVAFLVGLALIGWRHSRALALVSTALAVLAFALAVVAFLIT